MEEENLFEYEGVSYPESALREIYPDDFDKYVEQGVLTKIGDEEPVDVLDTQEESLYEYEGVSYPESSLRDLYPDDFDDYVQQGVLTKVDGLGKPIAVEDSAAAKNMDLVSEDGSLEFPREAKKPKYLVDGKEVNRAYLNDNLYKSDFVDKLQEGTVDVEIFNDPKLEELLKRQSESGSQWGDKIEAFNSGLSTLASGVVGAPGFIVDVFEEITGAEADIDAIDYLDELSEDLSKKAEELNNQQRAYKDDFIGSISEGNILDAVNIGFNTVSNSAPIMIAAGLTGGAGGVTGALTSAATMSGIMIPAEYASTKIAEDEKIKELSDGDKLTRAFFRGGAEGVFEGLMGPVGARSFSLFKDGVKNLVKTTAKESGAEAAKEVAEGMGKKTALEVFKTFGISTAGEGGSEALTSLSQDLTDDYLGIQDLSVEEYMRNAAEAGALGVFMGGVTTGALGGAGQVMSYLPLRNQKVYQGAKTEVREKQESGEINNEEAKQMDDVIESAKVALDKTDPSLSEENQERVAKLIDERERIKLEIEGLDENQVPVQNKKNRIDEINKEISEIGIEKPSTEEETGVPITPEEPVSVETAPAEEVTEITKEDYDKFVDTGVVDDGIINYLADKVRNNEELNDIEQAIFNDKTSEVEDILKTETEPAEEQAEISQEEKVKIAEKIGRARKVKAKNVSGLIDVMGGIFGLNKPQAQSAAVVGDVMIGNSAKRAGVSKDEMYQRIAFQKANEKDLPQGVKFQVDAFHGSPYQFDKFELSKIGTGEGAQAFGWGLYFTDLESIARNYAEVLSKRNLKQMYDDDSMSNELYSYLESIDFLGFDNEWQALNEFYKTSETEFKSNYDLNDFEYKKLKELSLKGMRNLYKVSLHKGKTPDQYNYINFDKPISDSQRKKVADYIMTSVKMDGYVTRQFLNAGFNFDWSSDGRIPTKVYIPQNITGKELYNAFVRANYDLSDNPPKKASMDLLEAGIDGIKYPAESIARGATSDNARGFNYVVFDENAVSIEEVIKFQKDAEKARGAMMMAMDNQAIIYALTDPNVSTPLHELAHVYEHYLTDAERKQIEKWSGHKSGTVEFSEKFARGFEKYLAEGKAPTPALQKYFDSFKQWLLDIYSGIKGSDIDVKLNDEMRSIYDQMLSEEVTEVKEKPKPKKRGKTKIQKAIDEFVDKKIPSTDKVSMSEKQALNKQIRDFARGMREAYKDQRNFRKRANKLISDNFQLFGDLTPSKVKALTRRAINIDFSKPDSLDKFIDYAAGLEQKTEDNARKDILKRVMRKIAPKKLKKRVGGILKGKISNYEGKVLSSIRNAIKEDSVESLQSTINELENKQEQGIKLSEKEIFLLQVAKISNNLLSGDLKKTLEAEAKIEALIKDGKSKYRENIKKRATEYARLVIESLPAITGGKKLTDQFGKLEQGAKRRPLTEAIRERLAGFLDYGEGLRTLLDKIDRTAERDESGYGGFLDKEAYEPVAKGRRKKDSLDTLKINELSDKLNELYGKRKKKALRENQKPKNLGTFTDGNGNEVNLFLSQNQAYPLYQYMQDPNNMATFQEMGFTDEMLQAVEDFLTPEVKEWADWQMSEFFPKYYDEINAVYKEMNDIDLPKQKIYVPIIRNVDGLNEAQRGVNETLFGDPQSTYKSLKQRQNSKAPFDMTKDGNEKLMEYVEGMNRYIAFSKPVKILNVIFKNKDVRNAIREFNSQETLTAIDGFIERIANNSLNMGQRIKLLDKLRGNTTIASLALAPTVTIKQLTSIPAYAADIPTSKFISGLGAFARNPKRAAEILMQSEYMQKRYKEGFERDILEGMKRDYDDMLNGTSNLKNKLMFLVKWGDKGAILMGGYSVYKYHFDKAIASGKSREQAGKIALAKFEEATKLSQQSTNPEDLSQFQTMGSLAKLFTMYMTSPISYFRQERKSARDFVKGYKSGNKKLMRNAVKRFTIYHFALPLVFQYVASGLPGLLTDWDEEDEKDLMRAASIGSLNGVFIAGQLISYFGDILTDKAWVRGGKFSPSPAFDAIVDIMNESEDVIDEWSKNPNKFSDDFMKEMIELGLSVDVAVGLPVNRVKKLIENWKTIADDNTLEVQEEIALGLGFSPYVVTPKKKAKTTEGRFKKSTREPKKSTREPK